MFVIRDDSFYIIYNWILGLFIIDGIITIPIALLGFMVMPGTTRSYLSVSSQSH